MDDESEVHCPKSLMYSKELEDGTEILVAKDTFGAIKSIRIIYLSGNSTTLQLVEGRIFTYISHEAVDENFYGHFQAKAKEHLDDRIRRQLRGESQASGRLEDFPVERNLQNSCTFYREVEVAVAVESSFCQTFGEAYVDFWVQRIMADVAADYQRDGLCFTVVVSHYEKHCDPETNPYREGVLMNKSGCGSGDGLYVSDGIYARKKSS